MRKIKFRAWLIAEKKMYVVGKIDMIDNFVSLIPYDYYRKRWHSFDECHLMQSSCFKDKNGVEVYEGDIFKHGEDDENFLISWNEDGYLVEGRTDCLCMSPSNIEIVGNKFENPELLKEIK